VVLPEILGWPYLGKAFDVSLHVGTLLALLAHFRHELLTLWMAAQRLVFTAGKAQDPEARLVKLLLIGSIPAAVAGFFLDGLVESHLQGLLPVALLSIAWSVALGWADSGDGSKRTGCVGSLTPRLAFLIGLAQATALLPGTSRSGVTITMALLLGLTRLEAARFSLLLSIPVVAGAALFKGWDCLGSLASAETARAVMIGIGVSAFAGSLCLRRFLAHLERGDFKPFVIYRIMFGFLLLAWLALRAC
jgi:undecaprenyl-diphosphatase